MSNTYTSDKNEAAKDVRLIRNMLQKTQNYNILQLGWILIAAGIINLFMWIFTESMTYFVGTEFLKAHDLLDFMGFTVRGHFVNRGEIFLQIRYAAFGLAWLALCVACIVKREGIRKNTVIRSELLLFDLWSWSFIYIPAMLLVSDAVADGVTYNGRTQQHLFQHNEYIVGVVVDMVIICFVLIMTGLMLKKLWVSICSGVFMACFICLDEMQLLVFDPNLYYITVPGFEWLTEFHPIELRYYIISFVKAVLLIGIGGTCIGVRLYHSVKSRRSPTSSVKTLSNGETSAETEL